MTIWFIIGYLSITLSEFPHSEICGSMDMCSLPQLIAACHVLRRLLVPRHPPCALLHLTKSVAWWRSSGLSLLQSNCYLTLSESFFFSLVFSVNHWNCNRYPNHFLEKLLVFISISFSLLTCLYTKYIFSFQGTLYFSVLVVDLGGLEPPASRLSGVRSNLLSYRSIKLIVQAFNLP